MSGHRKPEAKHNCAAISCTNSREQNPELCFFTYPIKEEERCTRWIINTRRDDFDPKIVSCVKYARLCEDHFEPSQFMCPADKGVPRKRKHLRRDAVPTLFEIPNASMKATPKQSPKRHTNTSTATHIKRGKVDMFMLNLDDLQLSMPKVRRMSLEQRRRKDRDRKREKRNQQREMQRLKVPRDTSMVSLDNAIVTDSEDGGGWKLYGTSVKEEKLECHEFTEQKQTLECDVYVKEEKLDSDVYVKEELTNSYVDGKEDEISSGRTIKLCSTTKVDGHNSGSLFVVDGLV